MEKCNQMTQKKNKLFYITDECGCKASVKIEYVLNGKKTEKILCKRHFKSNANWLNKIQTPFLKKDL